MVLEENEINNIYTNKNITNTIRNSLVINLYKQTFVCNVINI